LQKADAFGHSYHTKEKTRIGFDSLIAAIGDVRVAELTVSMGEAFIQSLHERGLRPTSIVGYVKQLRPVIHRVRSLLRRSCPACSELKVEVWEARALQLPKIAKQNVKVYDPHEVHALIASAREPLATAIALGVSTGLRRGALFNLCRFEVDLARGELRVQSKSDDLWEGTWAWEAKTVRDTVKPVPGWVLERVDRLVRSLPAEQPYLLIPPERYQRLRGKIGQIRPAIRYNPCPHMNNRLNALFEKAGIPKRHRAFHALKSTLVTDLLAGGMSPQDVGALADHASATTTMRYYAAVGGHRVEQARQILENLGPEIGLTRLERATSCTPCTRSSQTELQPGCHLTVHRYSTGAMCACTISATASLPRFRLGSRSINIMNLGRVYPQGEDIGLRAVTGESSTGSRFPPPNLHLCGSGGGESGLPAQYPQGQDSLEDMAKGVSPYLPGVRPSKMRD